jgi:biopolymer transport protein ExbD
LLAIAIVAVLVVIFQPQIERGLDWLRSLTASSDVAPPLAVPEPAAGEAADATVVVAADGAITVDGRKLTSAELPAALQAAFAHVRSRSPRVRIESDPGLPYVKLMEVVDTITGACGTYTEISIGVTDPAALRSNEGAGGR